MANDTGATLVQGDVVQIINNVFQHFYIGQSAQPPSEADKRTHPDPDVLRCNYLRTVCEDCGSLRTLGLDTRAGHAGVGEEADVRLESVYVNLDTERARSETMEGLSRRKKTRESNQEQMPLTALEACAEIPRLVLLGSPGSGKTTLARYLALCLAVHGLPPDKCPFDLNPKRHLPGWPGNLWPLPLRVSLRDFAREIPRSTNKGTADLLWKHVGSRLSPQNELKDMLRAELSKKDCVLVILDGLDEVLEKSKGYKASPRKLVLESVEGFRALFPDARYLITCRIASYVQPWVLPKFTDVRLAEFDQEKRDQFCELWYKELARRKQLDSGQVPGKVAGLRAAIRRPDLAKMAGNPLMLTVMALVHAREPELPEARALLYEKCVDVLLWLWEGSKADEATPSGLLSLLDRGHVDRTIFVRALDKLAYDVHLEGGSEPGEADIRTTQLKARLVQLHPDKDENWARDVATFMRERAGLLVEKQADEVDPILTFPHRTFQEYLAASWLVEGEDTAAKAAELAKQGDHWWEVIKLAAGRLLYFERKISQPIAMLDLLCPEVVPLESDCQRLARLAGEVLLELKPEQLLRDPTAGKNVEAKRDRIRDRVQTLLQGGHPDPRERAAAGRTLAKLGDTRFRADAWFLPGDDMLGFIRIPEGRFLMGSDKKKDPPAYDDELPQHEVNLLEFYIARFPVTVAQFRTFLESKKHEMEGFWQVFAGVDNEPVVSVTWYDAMACCDWLTERLCEWKGTPKPIAERLQDRRWRITLPSEAEWEKAARGTDGRLYPWIGGADPNRANYDQTGIGTTSAVGCFPQGAGPYGGEDMSGNVWEWTRSLWGTDFSKPMFKYPYDPKDAKRENLSAGRDVLRVLRGGSFGSGGSYARCDFPYSPDWYSGFRLVLSPV